MRQIRASLLVFTLAVAACGGGGGTTVTPPPPPPPTVDHVTIDNPALLINVGETRQLQVRALTSSGDLVPLAVITYTSSSGAVASVSTSGLVTALTPGTTTITASNSGKSATLLVTVRLIPVATFTVSAPRQTVKVNDTTRIVATLRDENNNLITDRTVTWQSSDPSVALVGVTGIILGLKVGGPVTITGTVEGKTATLNIAIVPPTIGSVHIIPDTVTINPGATLQFRVDVQDEFGFVVDSPTIIWTSLAPSVALASQTGLVTAGAEGDGLILATVGGVSAQSIVHVKPPETAKFRFVVTNHLKYPVLMTQNDVIIGQAEPNSVTTIVRPTTERARLGWVMVRPDGMGEPMNEEMPEVLNPLGDFSMTASNVLKDGRVFFAPEIRGLNGQKNPINFPMVELALPCGCSVSSLEITSRQYGYWRLFPGSTLEVYKQSDFGLTGPKLVFPVLPSAVEALTGIWRFSLLVAP